MNGFSKSQQGACYELYMELIEIYGCWLTNKVLSTALAVV